MTPNDKPLKHVNSGPEMPVMTRKEAEEAGLMFYWNGVSCKYDHKAKRRVKGGACMACLALANRANKDRIKNSIRTAKEERIKQAAEQTLGTRDKQKVLEIYAESGDLELAASKVGKSISEMHVIISRSTTFAADVYALEKRLRLANNGSIGTKYRPVKMEWSDDKRALFLRAYVDTGDIQAAREAIGCSPSEFNEETERNEEFQAQVEKAKPQAEQALEEKAIQLALAGNDKLLTVILKAKKPEYKDKIQIEQTTTIKHDDKTIGLRIAQLMEKYNVYDAEFSELASDEHSEQHESSGQGRITSESGGAGPETHVQQAPVYVSRDGRVEQVEVSKAS